MYPRLQLLKELLRDDGAIFISIDENEIAHLRLLMEEIFGPQNFIATIIWRNSTGPKQSKHFSTSHDYILGFAKNVLEWKRKLLPRTDEQLADYTNPDNDPRGPWRSGGLDARNYYSKGKYAITCPGGRVIEGPPWTYDFENATSDAPPAWWVGAPGKVFQRTVEGVGNVLVRPRDDTVGRRAKVFVGLPTMSGHTIEADVRGREQRRQRGDVGLINERYGMVLFGNGQKLELHPWQAADEMTVRVPFAKIVPQDLTNAVRASSDEVLVGEEPKDPSKRFEVVTGINLTLGDRVSLDTSGLTARIEGSITVRSGSDEITRGSGELLIQEGKYVAYGRKLDIQRGRLIYTGGPIGNPGIDIRAEKEYPEVVAGVNVRGTLLQPRLTFFSEPSLPQSQVVSLILAGGSLDSAQNNNRTGAGRLAMPRSK